MPVANKECHSFSNNGAGSGRTGPVGCLPDGPTTKCRKRPERRCVLAGAATSTLNH